MSDEKSKSKTAEVLKDVYIPVFAAAFMAFLLYQFCGVSLPDILSLVFIQCFGFGLAIGNTVQKFEYPRAAIIPGLLGVIIFCGLFGTNPAEILNAGKTYPLQAWLTIGTGFAAGFAMGKGGL